MKILLCLVFAFSFISAFGGVAAHANSISYADQASAYKQGHGFQSYADEQGAGGSRFFNVVKRKWRRDCSRAPGLCPWWEKCCPASFDGDGEATRYQCVDKKRRCPKPW